MADAIRILLRRDSAANWATNNPILADGEPGIESDTNRQKFGDGTHHWNYLPYASGTAEVGDECCENFGLPELIDGDGEFTYNGQDSGGGGGAVTSVNGLGGAVELTTSEIPEGSRLYFTAARVLATVLTGLSTATGTIVTSSHTILQAIGFLQKQVSDHTTSLGTKADLVAGKVPSSQLPSYVDDVEEYANLAAFPVTGESGKIYLAIDTNFTYRWGGSSYAQIDGPETASSLGALVNGASAKSSPVDADLFSIFDSVSSFLTKKITWAQLKAAFKSYFDGLYLDQSGAKVYAAVSGTDTYTATLSPAIGAYATGQVFALNFTNANGGAATINLNGLGAISIKKNGSTALAASDIAAGQVHVLVYDGTNFQLVGKISSGGGGASSPLTLTAASSTEIPLTLKAAGSQTANLLELRNSSNTLVGYWNAAGKILAINDVDNDFTNGIVGATWLTSTGMFWGGVNSNFAIKFKNGNNDTAAFNNFDYGGGVGGLSFASGKQVTWSSSTNSLGTQDVGIGRVSAGLVQITDGQSIGSYGKLATGGMRLVSPTVPSSASDSGLAGAIAWDSGFIYICVATNTWKRVAIATW